MPQTSGPMWNQNRLKLGTFSANCSGGMAVTKVAERWDNNWENNLDLVKQCEDKTYLDKIAEYGIKKVPAVVVSGELLDCCKDSAITEAKLVEAGIGQS